MNPGYVDVTSSHMRDLGPERARGAESGEPGSTRGPRHLVKRRSAENALRSASQLEQIGDDSRQALQQLQAQLEEYKEKARREVADAQRQAKEWASEAEKTSGGLSRLQDEVGA